MSKSFLERRLEKARKMRKSNSGKYTILGRSTSNNNEWVQDELDTPQQAIEEATRLTRAMSSLSDPSLATTYCAFTPEGDYLGGDKIQ